MLYGNLLADAVYGNLGDDTVFGGQGADALYGGQGADLLLGNRGEDVLFGNMGDDTLTGGSEADSFVFGANQGSNVITDFETGVDEIRILSSDPDLSAADLLALVSGSTSATLTVNGTTITLEGVAAADLSEDDFSVVFS